ncbi:SGNH/GDSL hydrolase family protein [Streptomyces sp. NBC_00237]|uniref:SGNH/GDSL hydrolase family protein n=1 Tax=Streptomyces sp. NBC_00237 TaxID=2975687 RepID=UPI00225A9484|nr:SGNH/GDSL hydrolase family protein [Streptomyces sp. NBC_00237]MCX5205661.1 SGNH/GDSL hydrolase family protein [Streptomyces sp. NBC_00237]
MNNTSTSRHLKRTAWLAFTAAAGAVALSACGSPAADKTAPFKADSSTAAQAEADDAPQSGTKPSKLLWMGDSIAEAEAPALAASFKADGIEFLSMAATGGGGVIGEIGAPTWEDLAKKLKDKPDVVAYQVTTYDWGTPAEQVAAYEKLAKEVNAAGAELVFVSAPPFKIDDFYKKNEAALKTAPESAKKVAEKNAEKVHFLDSSQLWGTDFSAKQAQRSKDGIHSCQQGAASFAQWLGKELGKQYGFTPAAADTWATGTWTGDKVFGPLGCK